MDYITPIAKELRSKFREDQIPAEGVDILFKYYALMVLNKGRATTSEDVYNCWVLWALQYDPNNKSIVPYSELSVRIQNLDDKFACAIRESSKLIH